MTVVAVVKAKAGGLAILMGLIMILLTLMMGMRISLN